MQLTVFRYAEFHHLFYDDDGLLVSSIKFLTLPQILSHIINQLTVFQYAKVYPILYSIVYSSE